MGGARAVAIVALAACGRIGFGPVGGGGGLADGATRDRGGPTGDGNPLGANYAFLVVNNVTLGSLGGIAGADARCQADAAAAGLPGTYVAWLSTSMMDASQRLAGARGWIRSDGTPFADTVGDLETGRVYSMLTLGANGVRTDDGISTVATATSAAGTYVSGDSCADFTSTAGNVSSGSCFATGSAFTALAGGGGGCNGGAHIYCFGVDHQVAVPPPGPPDPSTHRRAFLSSATWTPGGGLSSADTVCQSEANAAGLSGTFQALLATDTATALSRFPTGLPWARVDGIAIDTMPSDFMANGSHEPINVTATGAYITVGTVWTGSTDPLTVTSGGSCTSWTSAQPNRNAAAGQVEYGDQNAFFAGTLIPCSLANQLYCFER